jgi:hypothetical protein
MRLSTTWCFVSAFVVSAGLSVLQAGADTYRSYAASNCKPEYGGVAPYFINGGFENLENGAVESFECPVIEDSVLELTSLDFVNKLRVNVFASTCSFESVEARACYLDAGGAGQSCGAFVSSTGGMNATLEPSTTVWQSEYAYYNDGFYVEVQIPDDCGNGSPTAVYAYSVDQASL